MSFTVQLDGISSYGYASWLRLPKMLRIYRMFDLYRAMRESLAATSVPTVILRLLPLVLGLTHVYACIIWYIGTYGQPRSLEELQALDLDDTPHAWVFYYSGMGEEYIWPDYVCPPPRCPLSACHVLPCLCLVVFASFYLSWLYSKLAICPVSVAARVLDSEVSLFCKVCTRID